MNASSSLPPGYVAVERPTGRVAVVESAATWAGEALDRSGSLYEWASRDEAGHAHGSGGRGQVRIVAAPDASTGDRWVVRHYWRGGWMAPLLVDRYLKTGSCRAFDELAASHRLREVGVRTPAAVAAAEYPAGLYYRADLVTVWVPGVPLIDALRGADDAQLDVLLARTARAIEEVAGAGAYHVDLNAHNLLVDDDHERSPWVLDLDRIRFGVPPAEAARRMSARLQRSLAKLGAAPYQIEALSQRIATLRGAA